MATSAAYCCNPICAKPKNPKGAVFCQTCGQRLRLGDRFEAYSTLGSGNFSRTYLGLDTQTLVDPRCIIKAFVQSGQTETALETFRRETARLAEVSVHAQLPAIYSYFERGTQHYLVQEFVSGRSLLQQLTDEGTWDEARIRTLLAQLLPVLHLLHEHQIIHRDIKPANLIERDCSSNTFHDRHQPPVLVGFGAVKYATQSALAKTGTVLGSAEYAAPEQLVGKAIFASDLYSLGVTCLHLMTGLRPFDLYDSGTGQWFWESVAGEVSPLLKQILNRLIQGNASDRYRSAVEVMQDLNLPMPPAAPKPRHSPKPPENWVCRQTLETGAEVLVLALLPCGLLSGDSSGQLCLWDVGSGHPSKTWQAHPQAIAALATSADGQIVVTSGWDRALTVWDMPTSTVRHRLMGHSHLITSLAISADGTLLVSGGRDRTIRVWDLTSGTLAFTLPERRAAVEAIALSGQIAAVGLANGAVEIWHLGTREHWRTLAKHGAQVGAIAIAVDGEQVVSTGWDMVTQIRNSSTGAVSQRLDGHLLPVSALAVWGDGSRLVTGSQDGTLAVWDGASGTRLGTLSGHLAAVEAVVGIGSASGGWRVISGSRDRTIKFWEPTAD